jgi:hypothetical protein
MMINATFQVISHSIESRLSGHDLIDLEVDYKGEIVYNGQLFGTEQLGKAAIHVFNHSSIRNGDTIGFKDYINPLFLNNYGEIKNFIEILKIGKQAVKGKLAILDKIEIFPKYRKMGLFKYFLRLLLKMLKENMEVDYVFLKAFPFGVDLNNRKQVIAEQRRLESLYFKNGFRRFKTNQLIVAEGYILTYLYIDLARQDYTQVI